MNYLYAVLFLLISFSFNSFGEGPKEPKSNCESNLTAQWDLKRIEKLKERIDLLHLVGVRPSNLSEIEALELAHQVLQANMPLEEGLGEFLTELEVEIQSPSISQTSASPEGGRDPGVPTELMFRGTYSTDFPF